MHGSFVCVNGAFFVGLFLCVDDSLMHVDMFHHWTRFFFSSVSVWSVNWFVLRVDGFLYGLIGLMIGHALPLALTRRGREKER